MQDKPEPTDNTPPDEQPLASESPDSVQPAQADDLRPAAPEEDELDAEQHDDQPAESTDVIAVTDDPAAPADSAAPVDTALFPGADLPAEQPDGQITRDADDLVSDANAVDPKIDIGLLEAYLFSTHSPLTPGHLAELFNLESTKPIRKAIRVLNEQYESTGRCFRVEQVAGGFQLLTLPMYGERLNALHQREQDAKLTKAALETLSIIAYKQPILRADVEAIRGVASGETIRSLMEKHLVKIAGRAEEPGRPILYGTTKRFLEVFGLNSLKDLPQPDSPQAKQRELSRAAQSLLDDGNLPVPPAPPLEPGMPPAIEPPASPEPAPPTSDTPAAETPAPVAPDSQPATDAAPTPPDAEEPANLAAELPANAPPADHRPDAQEPKE